MSYVKFPLLETPRKVSVFLTALIALAHLKAFHKALDCRDIVYAQLVIMCIHLNERKQAPL